MKNKIIGIIVIAFSSFICGILISIMSYMNKSNINVSYLENPIFSSWWKMSFIFFIIQFSIFTLFILLKNISEKFRNAVD